MSQIRLRRLRADFEQLSDYVRRHPRVKLLQAQGDPPEKYQFEYTIRSLRLIDGTPKEVNEHLVEIMLPRNYPRTPPLCRMLTPVFHPNIAPHAICVGDHWSAGEPLLSIVIRIGEMLSYQSYNTKSPLNGDAAKWVEENGEDLPLDKVSMLVEEGSSGTNGAVDHEASAPKSRVVVAEPRAKSAPVESLDEPELVDDEPPKPRTVICPQCEKRYVIPPEITARRIRCKACQTIIDISLPTI